MKSVPASVISSAPTGTRDKSIVQGADLNIPAIRRFDRESGLCRVPLQAGAVACFLQSELVVAIPCSAELEPDVLAGRVRSYRVRSSTVPSRGADLERAVKPDCGPVLVRPEAIVARRQCVQQSTD